jgi:hypothetical protein
MSVGLTKWPRHARTQADRVEKLFSKVQASSPADVQVAVGEILTIRIAQILEEILPEVFSRLLCGASYMDGSRPSVLVPSKNIGEAIVSMRKTGRPKELAYLRWLKASHIRENLAHVLDPSDSAIVTVNRFAQEINEIRIVRNHAAHRSRESKAQYQRILAQYIGATGVSVPVGRFVMTARGSRAAPLIRYIQIAPLLIKELCKE